MIAVSTKMPEVASFEAQEKIIANAGKSLKKLLIATILIDAGLRPAEIVRLEFVDFDFWNKNLVVNTAKQRSGKTKVRLIPMSRRLMDVSAKYFAKFNIKNPHAYVFDGDTEAGHMDRRSVWRIIKKLSGNTVNPKMLRHSFATKIVNNGNDIRTAQYLMGHSSQQTTEIYTHINPEVVRGAINSIDNLSIAQRFKRWLMPVKPVHIMPMQKGQMTDYHVGREKEMALLIDLVSKKVNVLLLGAQGVGKTHLFDNFTNGKILRIDDLSAVKPTLAGMLLQLFNGDKEEIRKMLYGDETDWDRKVLKETIKGMTDLLVRVTHKNEYTIIIDDVEKISANGVKALEFLREHFHIICAARKVPISKITFLTNFQKMKLENLSRPETITLIGLAASDLRIRVENWEAFENRIWDNCNGNPQFTLEMIDRYRKERGQIGIDMIQEIEHTAGRQPIDMSMPFMILLASLMILRYVGREMGDDKDAFMLIGGIFMCFALFARPLLTKAKRKYV